jgi:hypothetical protein
MNNMGGLWKELDLNPGAENIFRGCMMLKFFAQLLAGLQKN